METLSTGGLGFSFWYVSHKLIVRRIITAILLILDISLAAYLLYGLVINFGVRQAQHDAAVASLLGDGGMAAISGASSALVPQPLRPGAIQIMPMGASADLVAPLVNPNAKWGAQFTYRFTLPAGTTAYRAGFIFPGETKQLYDLNVEQGAGATGIEISTISWVRDNDFRKTYDDRIRGIEFSGVSFVPTEELAVGQQLQVSRAKFTVTNKTAYSYRDARFTIILLSGSATVGINSVALDELRTGQSTPVEATWFGRLPRVTSVQIIPDINVLDPGVYLQP